MAITWWWWYHQWYNFICYVEMTIWRCIVPFGADTSTSAGISAMYHWQCHWCHVMLMPMASHNQKSYVASEFICLDLRNAVVPLMTPLTSCDASAGTIGVTQPKSNMAPHFNYLYLRNAMLPLMVPWASCNCGAKVIAWPKGHYHLSLIALT